MPGKPEALEPYKWKPGQSGNPSGRPRWATLMHTYRQSLDAELPAQFRPHQYWILDDEGNKVRRMTGAEAILSELWHTIAVGSEQGKLTAIKELSRADPHLSKPDLVLQVREPDPADRAASDAQLVEMLGKFLRRTSVTVEQVADEADAERTQKVLTGE